MKSKIVHFELTHNGIVVLCEDGSLWASRMKEYIQDINHENINWIMIQDRVKIKDNNGRLTYDLQELKKG